MTPRPNKRINFEYLNYNALVSDRLERRKYPKPWLPAKDWLQIALACLAWLLLLNAVYGALSK